MKRIAQTMLRLIVLIAATLNAVAALAASPPYMDDRSTPEDVVQSLYNAINRNEYLRAWSYFQPGSAPTYETFKSGYSDTGRVELKLGKAIPEGAAGSVQTKLPVAIRAHQTDGSSKVYEGCYTLIQVDPSVQDAPPFRPIQISAAHLTASSSAFSSASPSCD